MAIKSNTFLIKVYADAVENGVKKFKDIPEKLQVLVYNELENRMNAGKFSEDDLNKMMS